MFFVFISPSFYVLISPLPRGPFCNLTRLIRFNYNPHLIVITIFLAEAFHFLNWKASQLNCVCLNKVDIYRKKLYFHWRETFFTKKIVQMNHEYSAQKVHEKRTKKFIKSFFIVQIFMSVITLVFCFIFFGIWISVKFKDFFIIKTLFKILHVFGLLFKDRLKVQRESATCLLYTNMLHFYVALFLGRS